MNTEEQTDIIIEALEVFLNHILYVRDLYPPQIFKRRRIYNAPVFVSIFPPLNSYIHNILRTARELQQRRELRSIILNFYHDEIPLNECYSFEIKQMENSVEDSSMLNNDKFLIDFEEQLRCSLYKLAERLKPLEALPKGAQFRVVLKTTQEAFVRYSHLSTYQDFPWICSDTHPKESKREISLLPLSQLDTIGLKLNLDLH